MAKKAKRGVKPGTKRGPYRKAKVPANWRQQLDAVAPKSVGNLSSLMSELQSTISQLEGQLAAQIGRIKSILV